MTTKRTHDEAVDDGVEIALSIVRASLENEELCLAIEDAVRVAVVFAIGYGHGLAETYRMSVN